jgi:hypothetical protein
MVIEPLVALIAIAALGWMAIERGYVEVPGFELPQTNWGVGSKTVAHHFSLCVGSGGTCVIDGDTIRIEGQSVRIADIDAPEVRGYDCAREKALGGNAADARVGQSRRVHHGALGPSRRGHVWPQAACARTRWAIAGHDAGGRRIGAFVGRGTAKLVRLIGSIMGRRGLGLAGAGDLFDRGDLVVDHGQLALEPVDFAPLAGDHCAQVLNGLVLMRQTLFEGDEPLLLGISHCCVVP